MASLPHAVLGVGSLLALTACMEPVARRVNLPLSLVLVVVGAGLGWFMDSQLASHGALLDMPSEAFLFFFLPILLFETAIEIDVRRLLEEMGPILLLAVVAVIASTVVVGLAVAAVSTYSLVACLLVAAIVSTTDPVAVVALFKDLSVPHRLTLLVEGESLFNDAAAIALFSVLITMLTLGTGEPGDAVFSFVRSFAGGIAVGLVLSMLATRILIHLPGQRMAEVTVTVAVAYLAFVLSELSFHVSGVIAVVAATLVFAYDGRTRVSPKTWQFLVGTWKQLGYWASSLIFLLASLRIPGLLKDAGIGDLIMLGALLVGALAARGAVLFILMPLMCAIGIGHKVDLGLRLVILWGGLRGAISLALALAVIEHPGVSPEVKHLVAILVTAFVLFTLFVNGLTLRPLIRWLGIDRLEPVDRFLRGRAIAHSLGIVGQRLDAAGNQYRIEAEAKARLAEAYTARLAAAESALEQDNALSIDERCRAALISAAQREQVLLFQHYRERIVSGRIVRNLVARAYTLEDRAKIEGLAGYDAAAQDEVAFSGAFRLSAELQRRIGWQGPLSKNLADRQEALLVSRATLHGLKQFAVQRIPAMLGVQPADFLAEVLDRRLKRIEDALSALRLQYGEFTETMQTRYLERAALRIEFSEYQALIDEALISREVFNELLRDIDRRRRHAHVRPPLDLKLHPRELLGRVPFFQGLSPTMLDSLIPLMQPRFILPGETIIHAGDKGREMFFLASGAVQIDLSSGAQRLGSGDFFGELALLTHAPRAADVRALGFCELLVMSAPDFTGLLERHADLQAHIADVVRVRQARG